MNPTNKALALLMAGAFAACADPDPMDSSERMQLALSDAEVENTRHAQACKVLPSLPLMLSETDLHARSMGEVMARMGDARAGMHTGSMMGHCTRDGLNHMSQTLDALHRALADHVANMRAVDVVADARIECKNHTAAAGDMMHGMIRDLDSSGCMDH